jgi:hypothetical protein
MNPVPLDYVSFARIPKRDRVGDYPQYRIYIRGVPGGLGAGYTDVLVLKITQGWYLIDRKTRGGIGGREVQPNVFACEYHRTRDAAVMADLHHCEAQIPENVRAYLAEVNDG